MSQPVEIDYERLLFGELVASLEHLVERLQKEYKEFCRTMREAYNGWEEYIGYVESMLKEIDGNVKKILKIGNDYLNHSAPILSLFIASFGWISGVMSPASNVKSKLKKPENPKLADWRGRTQKAYVDALPYQDTAAGEMVTRAKFLSDWLYGLGMGNIQWIIEYMKKVLLPLSKHITAAIADAATILGALEGIGEAAELVAELVAVPLDALLELPNKILKELDSVRAIKGTIEDYSAFPDGHWPSAVNVKQAS